MRFKALLCLVMLMFLCAVPCSAWGPDGHRIIADIAMEYLNPTAKAEIAKLLGEQSLGDASNWADEIRKNPEYDWAKPLHYINVPLRAATVDMQRDCPDGKCVVEAIRKYTAILRDQSASKEQRVEALKFVAHFVGDVHQPLHVSYEHDRGGNMVKVTFCGEPNWNLHSVWDDAMIKRRMAGDRQAMTKRLLDRLGGQKAFRLQASPDPEFWANESLTITRRVYREHPADGVLTEAYYQKNITVVEDRLVAAGLRLAALLNNTFPDKSTTKPAATSPATRPQAMPNGGAPPSSRPATQPASSSPASGS